jgi:diguanylate cyclase (GGDEF)-like protein
VRLRSSNALIYIDDVTGLYNQRKLQKDLDYCINRNKEYGESFIVFFIDVDHFKNVNDGHGHLIGTKLLLELGVILRQTLRESDLIYRYGGDEFVVLVPKANTLEGKMIGERLLSEIKNNEFLKGYDGPHPFRLFVSIGISTFPQDAKTRQEILSMADQMMYQAKRFGRGQVCMTSEFFNK